MGTGHGLVFNIQRFSIHDGPGIRTTIFLKGCNLHCLWCQNPESLHAYPEIEFIHDKCIECGRCYQICPGNAHKIKNGSRIFDREMCIMCGKCVESCYAQALVTIGRTMSVKEVMDGIKKDQPFYRESGGVTFSGGEPLLQKDFLKMLLQESKRHNIHTALDTAGNVPWANFEEILEYVDLFLYDIKMADETKHREATGVGNKQILENLRKLSNRNAEIWVRVPIIAGLNDSDQEIKQIAYIIDELKLVKFVEPLPMHHLGEGKYHSLGIEFGAKNLSGPSEERMNKIINIFRDAGLNTKS